MTGFTPEDEPEGRAFARGGLDRHFAAVQLGDVLDDREPEARSP